jgi:fatty acid desaturase
MHIWLSKPVYELLPYFYLLAGLAALAASVYLDYWYWPGICLVAGILLVIAGVAIWLKRHDFRHNRRAPRIEHPD